MNCFLSLIVGFTICIACGCGSEFEMNSVAPVQSAKQAGETEPKDLTVVFVSPGEVKLLDRDGDERWLFRCDNGEFFRDSSGQSRCSANDELLFLSTTTSVLALEIESGELRWSFDYTKPSVLAFCTEVVAADDRVFVTVNQIGAPMACLDTTDGKLLWNFPSVESEEQMGFDSTTVKDNFVLFRATISKEDGRGYDYENQALDILTGESIDWPSELTEIPKHVPAKQIGVTFGDESSAPKQDGELFTGVISFSKTKQYHFERPAFYSGQPLYKFEDVDDGEFAELLGRKVQIRGEVISIQESQPPIITIRVFEAIAMEEAIRSDKAKESGETGMKVKGR